MFQKSNYNMKNVAAIIYYSKNINLYPISEFLHPGIIPIGDAYSSNPLHNLPNLDWKIAHLKYFGIEKIYIVSEFPLLGIELFYKSNKNIHFYDISKNMQAHNGFFNIYNLKNKTNIDIFFIENGMIFSNINYKLSIKDHIANNHVSTLIGTHGYKYRVGIARAFNNKIIHFEEKPFDETMTVNTNTIIINSDLLFSILDTYKNDTDINDIKNNINLQKILIEYSIKSKILKLSKSSIIGSKLVIYDLRKIENWIKLNINDFINNFSYLSDIIHNT